MSEKNSSYPLSDAELSAFLKDIGIASPALKDFFQNNEAQTKDLKDFLDNTQAEDSFSERLDIELPPLSSTSLIGPPSFIDVDKSRKYRKFLIPGLSFIMGLCIGFAVYAFCLFVKIDKQFTELRGEIQDLKKRIETIPDDFLLPIDLSPFCTEPPEEEIIEPLIEPFIEPFPEGQIAAEG